MIKNSEKLMHIWGGKDVWFELPHHVLGPQTNMSYFPPGSCDLHKSRYNFPLSAHKQHAWTSVRCEFWCLSKLMPKHLRVGDAQRMTCLSARINVSCVDVTIGLTP